MAVQQIGNARAHVVEAREGLDVKPGDRVHLSIDAERRRRVEAHHTATHLLHCALHQVVSPDAAQQGSFVSEDRLRFDFNSGAVTPDQLRRIEEKVNGWIEEALPVHCTERAYADVKGNSAIAQFSATSTGTWCAWSRWAAAGMNWTAFPWSSAAARTLPIQRI